MRNQTIRRAASLAVVGVLFAAAGVLADTIRADGDVITDGVQGFVELPPVAPGTVFTVDVSFQLECSGTNKHVDADQTVTLTLSTRTVPQGGDATATTAVINPPGAGWPVDGTGCASNPAPIRSATSSRVTLTAPNRVASGLLYTLSYVRSLSPQRTTDSNTFSGSTNVTFTFDTVSNQAPSLNMPTGVSTEADRTGGANVNYTVTASDPEDDPDPAPSCTPASGSLFQLGATTVNCTVTDSGQQTTTGSFVVTVVDTTAPTLHNVPADLTVVTNDPSGVPATWTNPIATDVADANPSVNCVPASGSTFAVGDTTVACTATDGSGNSAVARFAVHVHLNAKPALSVPGSMTVEGDRTGGANVTFVVAALDAEDGALTPTCDAASGSFFALGATTVNCSVSDKDGATTTGAFTITVVDTTAPTLANVPSGASAVTNGGGASVSYSNPTATDVVDANPSVACVPASGSTFPVGDSTVTCTATDASGNTSTATFPVSVHLNAAPVLSLPGNLAVEGNRTGGATVDFNVSATDAEDNPAPSATCDHASGSFFALGDTTVTCRVTDANGLSDSGSFKVTVRDTTAPRLSGVPSAINVSTTNPGGTAVTYADPSATDVVDASPYVGCSPASGANFAIGDTTVTCTARDDSGNSSTASFVVHVALASSDTYTATWDEPIGGTPLSTNGSRTVPVKVRLFRNGTEITTGTAFLRLTPCAGVTGPSVDTVLTWNGSRWTGKIDTSDLSGSCYNVTAMAGGSAVGTFRLDVTGASPTKAPNPNKGPNKPAKP